MLETSSLLYILPGNNVLEEESMARILIADDDLHIRELLRQLLEGVGHEVTTVSDGLQACRVLDAKKYDLVFMDIIMPVLDGASAAMDIRENSSVNQHTPIVGFSSNDEVVQDYGRQELGFTMFMLKPFDDQRLEQALQLIPSDTYAT